MVLEGKGYGYGYGSHLGEMDIKLSRYINLGTIACWNKHEPTHSTMSVKSGNSNTLAGCSRLDVTLPDIASAIPSFQAGLQKERGNDPTNHCTKLAIPVLENNFCNWTFRPPSL